jgi:uridine kinase
MINQDFTHKGAKRMEIDRLLEHLRALSNKREFVLVGIDGLGGAGKSTVAKCIRENIQNTTIIDMDDFYVPQLKRADWHRVHKQVIKPLRNGSSAYYQRFDWDIEELAEWHTVEPKGVIVLEGVYSLHEKLRDAYNYKIWVEAPYELRLQRGIARDG